MLADVHEAKEKSEGVTGSEDEPFATDNAEEDKKKKKESMVLQKNQLVKLQMIMLG